MERGHELEHEAREFYEGMTLTKVSNGGFCELNSWIGFCRVEAEKNEIKDIPLEIQVILKEVQNNLFVAQAEIAAIAMDIQNNSKKITAEKTIILEQMIKKIDLELPPLTKFIISTLTRLEDYTLVGGILEVLEE